MSGRGVERMLDLLEWLAETPGPYGLSAISTALDMPKSSTLLMLRSLTERGYLERLPAGDYALRRLPGDGAAGQGALLALVGPYLARAVEETGESGFLAVLEKGQIRYLNKILPAREIRYDRDISMTRAAHKVASGVVLLAAGDDAALEAHAEAAGLSDEERAALLSAVDKAREAGFFLNLKGVVEGAAGAASVIRDATGRPVGAINISGPQPRLAAHAALVGAAVLKTATEVTEELRRRGSRISKGGEGKP
ncbi:iron ABC transporter substrate-binding protein [Cereibacter sphaeroides]|nr:iron ABC transporter substrate-binding protein [Cereibacter sphaeroides]